MLSASAGGVWSCGLAYNRAECADAAHCSCANNGSISALPAALRLLWAQLKMSRHGARHEQLRMLHATRSRGRANAAISTCTAAAHARLARIGNDACARDSVAHDVGTCDAGAGRQPQVRTPACAQHAMLLVRTSRHGCACTAMVQCSGFELRGYCNAVDACMGPMPRAIVPEGNMPPSQIAQRVALAPGDDKWRARLETNGAALFMSIIPVRCSMPGAAAAWVYVAGLAYLEVGQLPRCRCLLCGICYACSKLY